MKKDDMKYKESIVGPNIVHTVDSTRLKSANIYIYIYILAMMHDDAYIFADASN